MLQCISTAWIKNRFSEQNFSVLSLICLKMLTTFLQATKTLGLQGGRHSTSVAFALLTQPARVRFSAFPKFFSENYFDVAEVYRQRTA